MPKVNPEYLKSSIYFDSRIHNIDEYRDLVRAIYRGEATPGTHIEKLKGYKVLSARIDGKGRILFTYSKINKQKSLVVLEILENHEYEQAKFLKKNVLKKYLERNQAEITGLVTDANFEEAKIPEELQHPQTEVDFIAAYESKKSYVILDESQETILDAPAPMFIEGPPGSGKTLLAQGLMKQAIADGAQKVLYVSPSPDLTRRVLRELRTSVEYDPTKVDVIPYDQLVQPNLQVDGLSILKECWKNIKNIRTVNKRKLDDWGNNLSGLYEEFKIISGFTKDEYCSNNGVGKKQTLLGENQNTRQLLYTLYQRWMQYLKQKKIRLRDFYEFLPEELRAYDLIVVDESQYLSNIAILNLLKIVNKNNIVICSDRRQNPNDEMQKNIQLSTLINGKTGRLPQSTQLSTHYRCPQNVMKFAKAFNTIRTEMAINQKAELEVVESKEQGGFVHWIEPTSKKELIDTLEKLHNDPNVCVVASQSKKEEAKRLGVPVLTDEDALKHNVQNYLTPEQAQRLSISNVLTREEVIGLEFDTVILYNTLSTPQMKMVNQWLEGAKYLTEEIHSAGDLSANFIAATRATERLIMIQNSKEHGLESVIQKLKETQTLSEKIEIAQVVTSEDEWEARAIEAVDRGHIERARLILRQHLNVTDESLVEAQIESWLGENGVEKAMPNVDKALPLVVSQVTTQPEKIKQDKRPPSKKKANRIPRVESQVPTQPKRAKQKKRPSANNMLRANPVSETPDRLERLKSEPAYLMFMNAFYKAKDGDWGPFFAEFNKEKSLFKPEYFVIPLIKDRPQTSVMYYLAAKRDTIGELILTKLLKTPSAFKATDFTTRSSDSSEFLLQVLAYNPKLIDLILDQYQFKAEVFTMSGALGKSVLWTLAANVNSGVLAPEIMMKFLKQYEFAFQTEDFWPKAQADEIKEQSVLLQLIAAIDPGHPECLLEVLRQYPDLINQLQMDTWWGMVEPSFIYLLALNPQVLPQFANLSSRATAEIPDESKIKNDDGDQAVRAPRLSRF